MGRYPHFDNGIEFLSENDLKDSIFVAIFWWHWFRRADTATLRSTREHLLSNVVRWGGRRSRGQNPRSHSAIPRTATIRAGAALRRTRRQYQRPRGLERVSQRSRGDVLCLRSRHVLYFVAHRTDRHALYHLHNLLAANLPRIALSKRHLRRLSAGRIGGILHERRCRPQKLGTPSDGMGKGIAGRVLCRAVPGELRVLDHV